MRAIVFDWDGTLVSCNERIDRTIKLIGHRYPEAKQQYDADVAADTPSPGWIRCDRLVSLPEDYFSHRFGLLSQALCSQGILSRDESWDIILKTFRNAYSDTEAKPQFELELLKRLASVNSLYIVTNSATDNVARECEMFGLDFLTLVGHAKKYHVAGSTPEMCCVPADRPIYRQILEEIDRLHEETVVVGDSFSCDLTTPMSLGWRVFHVPNQLTPSSVRGFLQQKRMIAGSLKEIVTEHLM